MAVGSGAQDPGDPEDSTQFVVSPSVTVFGDATSVDVQPSVAVAAAEPVSVTAHEPVLSKLVSEEVSVQRVVSAVSTVCVAVMKLVPLGVASLVDLASASDAELAEIGMKRGHIRKLRLALAGLV